LAFVGCGNSDSGENSGGGDGPPPSSSSVVPTGATLQTLPTGAASGKVYEGQPVVLEGIQLTVNYNDGATKIVNDWRSMIVEPNVYLGDTFDYDIYYTEAGRTVKTSFPVQRVYRIVSMDVTPKSTLAAKSFKIDDVPDLSGLTFDAWYSTGAAYAERNGNFSPRTAVKFSHDTVSGPAEITYAADDNDNNTINDYWNRFPYALYFYNSPDVGQQASWTSRALPFDISNPNYRWAWVWNITRDGGSFEPSDAPGVLLSVGTFGLVASPIAGKEAGVFDDGYWNTVNLYGNRLPISRLHQVTLLEISKAPSFSDPVFYDNPGLIGAVAGDDESLRRTLKDNVLAWQDRWIDFAFKEMEFKVTYSDGDSRNFSINELQKMNGIKHNIANYGYGESWANLEFYPISRAGYSIDVRADNKEVVAAEEGNIIVENFNPYRWQKAGRWLDPLSTDDWYWIKDPDTGGPVYAGYSNARVYYNGIARVKDEVFVVVGDGGWAQWAALSSGTGQTRFRFYWRDKKADLPIPLYNQVGSQLEVAVKEGIAFPPVVMDGFDAVYKRPETMNDFLRKLVIKVPYTKRGGDANDIAYRPDLMAAQGNGTCRSSVGYYIGPSREVWQWGTEANHFGPSLYSTNIFNFDTDWGQAQVWQSAGAESLVSEREAKSASALGLTNSQNYLNRQRSVGARIVYVAWAGNPDATRQSRSNNVIQVGPSGYTADPPSAE